MGCGTKCLKVMVVVLNLFFWLLGLGILAAGLWIKVDIEAANIAAAANIAFSEPVVDIAVWIFIGAGILVFVVGFLGCCGAIKESKLLLGFYIFFVVLVFIAEVAAGAYIVYRWDEIEDDLKVGGSEWVKKYYDNKSDTSKGLNYIQSTVCCCGLKSYRDYEHANFSLPQLPDGIYYTYSCCKPTGEVSSSVEISIADKAKCLAEATAVYTGGVIPDYKDKCSASFRTGGCVDSLIEKAKDNMLILFAVGFAIAFVQLIIFVLAVCLCRRIQLEEKSYT